jgi:outer membrane receptor protein involved in Fe transport
LHISRSFQALLRNLLFIIALFSALLSSAQADILVKGTVIESESSQAIPFASISARSLDQDEILGGTNSDLDGSFEFNISSSECVFVISFMGFKDKSISDFQVNNGQIDLGIVSMEANSERLEEIEVLAEKSKLEFKLDKRVFNVGQDISSSGMGALDVLNNVPSVNVDVEGQVSLRGNTGVQILINGKPSVLSDDGSTALATITSDMIERIEVITNPSAKYAAEGSSGIINIVLKKEEKKGFNGSFSLNTGIPDNHSIGASLNKRTENFNFFTQFGVGYRSLPSFKESRNLNLIDSTEVKSEGIEYRNERFFNITLGTDYYINDHNIITLSGSYAFEDEEQPSETDFEISNSENQILSKYRREEITTAGNPKYQYDLQYERQFKDHEDHVLQLSTQGSFFGKQQSSDFINTPISGIQLDPNQKTETDFFQRDFIHQLDYVKPFSNGFTLEAGAQYESNDVGNDYAVYNESGSGDFVIDSNLTNDFSFKQKVLGVYSTAAYEGEKWGLKLGARVENTSLNTLLRTTNEKNDQLYTNLFPSFHSSYKISSQFSIQAGYSRRIYRPRLWDLNPFFNIRNNYNVRRGNPDLLPEYADSYELTAILIYEKLSFNASLYNLYTTEVIERISFLEDNVNVTMPVNIGTRNQTGIEINGKYSPNNWFSLNGDFNYGYFVRNGSFAEQDFDFEGRQWFTRMTSRFKMPADVEVEVSGEYQSSYKTVQGEVSGFAFMDVGLRKKLWKGKAVINLSVRDVFASRIRESVSLQPTFQVYDFSQRGRFITLGFSYSFGKGEAMSYSGRRR